jgi:hypothetical protein
MKCARCGKVKETVRMLWKTGPNGNRVYEICTDCKPKVEKDNGTK